MDDSTVEKQYSRLLEVRDMHGQEQLGLMMNQAWFDDPKRLVFTFARYKFVAKMMSGFDHVLEVGCGDAFPSRIVRQSVNKLSITDFDPIFIDDINNRAIEQWSFENVFVYDLLAGPLEGAYNGVYALDVLEHIEEKDEDAFLSNMSAALASDGTMIIGMPSLESQKYASKLSIEGHVNCKTQSDLKKTMERHFQNVYMFSMNDEVLHIGFDKMSQYVIALCNTPKNRS
ncbi:MAG: SAM-dependent methyltransferase [Blastopirellula sp.]|nr:MAG: SAM-dependent methyltransferase [Blastopirellula sp.]